MAAVDFSEMDLASAADVLSALRDELAERARRCDPCSPAGRSQRTILCGVLRLLGEAEDGLRKAAGTALPRTDLPVPDEPRVPRRSIEPPSRGLPGLPPGRPHP